MRLKESVLVEKLEQWLHYCDAGDLAEVAGKAFNGDCYMSPKQSAYLEEETVYEFEPNGNYSNDFDDLDEEE